MAVVTSRTALVIPSHRRPPHPSLLLDEVAEPLEKWFCSVLVINGALLCPRLGDRARNLSCPNESDDE